jgi:fluoride exporter
MIASILSICAGASLGALLRWLLAGRLNPLFPALPLGTLAANLIGGYLIGVAVAVFANWPELSPQARLFVVTGFLGGLTTFSTFSAESATLLLRQQYLWFSGHVAVHVVGSLAMTVLGIFLTRSLLRH